MSTSTSEPSNCLPAALDMEVGIPRLGLLSNGITPAGRRSTGCGEVWRWRDFILAYKTLGVVFGGLVTSPLYVYPSMNLNSPTEEDYLGIYSIMFWTLTLIGVFKYVFIALNADDNGEGGTFALYSLLCRHINIGNLPSRNVNSSTGVLCSNRSMTSETRSKLGKFLEESITAQRILLFIAMLGMCMLIGDGILTPAISVLSAIDGLRGPFPFRKQIFPDFSGFSVLDQPDPDMTEGQSADQAAPMMSETQSRASTIRSETWTTFAFISEVETSEGSKTVMQYEAILLCISQVRSQLVSTSAERCYDFEGFARTFEAAPDTIPITDFTVACGTSPSDRERLYGYLSSGGCREERRVVLYVTSTRVLDSSFGTWCRQNLGRRHFGHATMAGLCFRCGQSGHRIAESADGMITFEFRLRALSDLPVQQQEDRGLVPSRPEELLVEVVF
ncbi:hypothetical protein KFK09_013851 [Dendrobium nobile]|uniref:K+ potassium transporter integral membrane domain-containing protein n=1 Tax=Dendrobium nobile TaxID=94219 RepID=A0A8T3B8E7_DENNO|nr:hypothetical protein KFK09_013851 [Dendrobium nobile]